MMWNEGGSAMEITLYGFRPRLEGRIVPTIASIGNLERSPSRVGLNMHLQHLSGAVAGPVAAGVEKAKRCGLR